MLLGTTSTTTVMSSLPNEILLLIVRNFTLPETINREDVIEISNIQRTLWSLCLTSRQLYTLAQPLLYRTFVKQAGPPSPDHPESHIQCEVEDHDGEIQKHTSLENFIRTLIDRPDLAVEVRRLRIENFTTSEDDNSESESNNGQSGSGVKRSFDPALASLFCGALAQLPDPRPDKVGLNEMSPWSDLHAYLADGFESAEVALLLTLVPNVQSLYMEPDGDDFGLLQDVCDELLGPCSFKDPGTDGWSSFNPATFLSQTGDSRPILNHLKYLEVRSAPSSAHKARFDKCVSLLALPTLESFIGQSLVDEENIYDYGEFYHLPLAHIRRLRLESCLMTADSIRALVSSCSALQSLEVLFANSNMLLYEIDVGDEIVDPLNELRDSLERLVLTIPQGFSSMTTATPFDVSPLRKLRSLEVDMMILPFGDEPSECSIDHFPRSLTSLTIHNSDGRALPFLSQLITASEGLKTIKVSMQTSAIENDLEHALKELSKQAIAADLDFTCDFSEVEDDG